RVRSARLHQDALPASRADVVYPSLAASCDGHSRALGPAPAGQCAGGKDISRTAQGKNNPGDDTTSKRVARASTASDRLSARGIARTNRGATLLHIAHKTSANQMRQTHSRRSLLHLQG